MNYLDFDLVIEPSGDGYTARVLNSPGGQASADFTTLFSDLEIENFLLRVGRSRNAVRRIESPEMASAKAFGAKLFNGVFAGDVRGCLRSSLDEANRQGAGLRVRLHLQKAPALADLPWEFLYNASMNRFLGLSVATPLVRYLELPEMVRPLAVTGPLRILMMISSPTDYPQLDVKRESEKMTQALGDLEQRGLITVERLEDATLSALQRRLRQGQYHIFHFVGHGAFDTQADDGILLLEDQEERGRRVSAQFLGTLLHDHRSLRLAVLNACEGARASRCDPFAGTAQSLVQQGIPAVIAMQFEVTDEAAICLTREFYAAIAVGYPVDAALAEARKAIFAEVSEIEWGTPVLYMRSPDGRIFDVKQVSEVDRTQVRLSSLLQAARVAVQVGDEATAVDKLGQVLALDPKHADAAARLQEIKQKAAGDEERKKRRETLRRAASDAMAREQWDQAIEQLRALVALDPDDHESRGQLSEARRQRDLAALYSRGRAHFERRQWREALAELHQVQQLAIGYKDVPVLLATIERELAQPKPRQDDPNRRVPIGPPSPPVKPAPAAAGGAQRFLIGGAVGAVVVVGALIVGGIVIAIAWNMLKDDPDSDSGGQYFEPPANPGEMVPAPPAVRAELANVLFAANNALIQAYRALDPGVLQPFYTGSLLQEHQQKIAMLAKQQLFAVNTLHDQRMEAVSVSRDGQRAEVRVIESWSSNFHNAAMSGQPCVSHFHQRPVSATVFLQRAGNGWLGYEAKPDDASIPEASRIVTSPAHRRPNRSGPIAPYP